jgi:hypothetical protein
MPTPPTIIAVCMYYGIDRADGRADQEPKRHYAPGPWHPGEFACVEPSAGDATRSNSSRMAKSCNSSCEQYRTKVTTLSSRMPPGGSPQSASADRNHSNPPSIARHHTLAEERALIVTR